MDAFFDVILSAHSFIRYGLIFLLLFVIIKSTIGYFEKKEYVKADNLLGIIIFIVFHFQLLVGLILYFNSPIVQVGFKNMGEAMKDPEIRYWTVEHISVMVVSVVLVTVSRIIIKRESNDVKQHKKTMIFSIIIFVLIMSSIPWPFSTISRPWY